MATENMPRVTEVEIKSNEND